MQADGVGEIEQVLLQGEQALGVEGSSFRGRQRRLQCHRQPLRPLDQAVLLEARQARHDDGAGLDDLGEYFEFTLPTHAMRRTSTGLVWDATDCRTDCSWFGFMLRVKPTAPFTHSELGRHLDEKKIGNRMLFGGNLMRQPAMIQLRKDRPAALRIVSDLSGADSIMNSAIFVGVYPGLSREMLNHVIDTTRAYIHNF